MAFIYSALYKIPGLRYFFKEEKNQLCDSTTEDKEYIAPLFQTVAETPQPVSTRIIGTVPEWITGSLFRNGPGRFEFGNDKYNHWFDGMALMHKFTIENGNVTYMSKFLRSDAYMLNESANRIVVSEYGTAAMSDPCKNVFQRFVSMFELPKLTDNGNINFMKYKKDFYVSTETNLIRKVDLATLETAQKVDWRKYIAVNGATAHPHYDPDGTVYNMGSSYGKQGILYNIIKIPAPDPEDDDDDDDTLHGAQVICSIPASDNWNPSYFHSFGMTENYIVFTEQPVKINVFKIITSNITGTPISNCLYWDPRYDTVFHVANKHTGNIHSVTFHTKATATFHQVNAYEDEDCIVLDLFCQDNGDVFKLYELQNLHKSGRALDETYNSSVRALPLRFVLPLTTNSKTPYGININPLRYSAATVEKRADGKLWCTPEKLWDRTVENIRGLEFPSINYSQYNTKKYRYFYGCGFQSLVGNYLVKVDVDTKQSKVWHEDGYYPSEAVFVPSPNSSAEDDGVVLSVVVSPRQGKTPFLLILDAKNFKEIGRAEVPVHMPYGLHGMFRPHNQ